jgi:WD40 repeat protein/TolB-like protein
MWKRVLLLSLAILLLCPLRPAQADFKKIKIAVLDFQQNGRFDTPDVGKMVAEWFTTALVETGRFDIIERRLLQQIVDEQKIGASGIVEPGSASKLGRVLGVKTVVTGTVQSFDGRLEINARVINVETGSIISAEKVKSDSATNLTELVKQISAKIIRAFPLEGYVVQRTKDRVVIDLGRQAGVQPGMSFTVYTEGKPMKHPITHEVLDIEKIEKGVVEILEVKEKIAYAKIIREVATGAIGSMQLVRVNGELFEPPLPPDPLTAPLASLPDLPDTPKPMPVQPEQHNVLRSHTGDIKAISFSSSGKLVASAGKDNAIILWDARTWQPLATLHGHTSGVKAVRFSKDDRYLASGSGDETVIVWDVREKKEVRRFKVGKTVNAVAFSPDGKLLASGSNSKSIFLWDLRSGAKLHTCTGKDDVFALAFSPNGKILAAAGNNQLLQLWDTETGALIRDLKGHRRDVRAVTFNKAGNLLISGSNDEKILYWDISNGTQVKVLEGHKDSVLALALSSDGNLLVSGDGSKEGGIIIWNAQNGQELERLNCEEKFEALALSPDGSTLLLGSNKNLVVRRIK